MRTHASLRKWLKLEDDDIDAFLQSLTILLAISPGHTEAPGSVPRDPDDEIIIAAAIEANADYIVTEDKDLTSLGEFDGIPILNRIDFHAELDRLGVPPLNE